MSTPEYKLQQRELTALAAFNHRSRPPFARLVWPVVVWLFRAALIAGTVSSIFDIVRGNIDPAVTIAWVCLIGAFGYEWALASLASRKTARDPFAVTQVTQRITIRAAGLLQETSIGASFVQWRALGHVGRDSVSVYFILRNVIAFVVPLRCFANKDDADSFHERAMALYRAAPDDPSVDMVPIESWTQGRKADLTYTLTRADLAELEILPKLDAVPKQRRLPTAVILYGALTLCGVGFSWLDASRNNKAELQHDIALACASAYLIFLIMRRSLLTRTVTTYHILSILDTPWQLWVFPTHCVTVGPFEQRWHMWTSVHRLDSDDHFVYLHYRNNIVITIPRRTFASPEDAQQFVDTIRRYHEETVREAATSDADADVWPPSPVRR